MGMDSVFRVSLVLDMVDNMTSKVQGAADGVPSAVQKMNDAFGTMQKAGVAMTGMGTAIVGACMGTVTATFDTQDALAEVASLGVGRSWSPGKGCKELLRHMGGNHEVGFHIRLL